MFTQWEKLAARFVIEGYNELKRQFGERPIQVLLGYPLWMLEERAMTIAEGSFAQHRKNGKEINWFAIAVSALAIWFMRKHAGEWEQ